MLLMYKQKETLETKKGNKKGNGKEKEQAKAKDENAGDPGRKDRKDHNQELGDTHRIPQDVKCILIKFLF